MNHQKEKIMFKFLVLFLLLLSFSILAFADDLSVDVNLTAHHWNRTDVAQQHLNEFNPGVGLHFTDGDYHKLIGFYDNSYKKLSVYGLMAWTPIKLGPISIIKFQPISIGPFAGVVTGYSAPYKPAAGLYLIAPITKKYELIVTAVPTIKTQNFKCYGFAALQLNVKF
jgi:hypothetical protein